MKVSDGKPNTADHEWIVYVNLGDVDGVIADEWMDAITEAVFARDPSFSGVVGMRKEPNCE